MGYSGARGTLIYEKNLEAKISCQTPFNCRKYNSHTRTYCKLKTKFDLIVGSALLWILYILLSFVYFVQFKYNS